MINSSLEGFHHKKDTKLRLDILVIFTIVYAFYFCLVIFPFDSPINSFSEINVLKLVLIYFVSSFSFGFLAYKILNFFESVRSYYKIKYESINTINLLKISDDLIFYSEELMTRLRGSLIFSSFITMMILPFLLRNTEQVHFGFLYLLAIMLSSIVLMIILDWVLIGLVSLSALILELFIDGFSAEETNDEESLKQSNLEESFVSTDEKATNTFSLDFKDDLMALHSLLTELGNVKIHLSQEELHMMKSIEEFEIPALMDYYNQLPIHVQKETKNEFLLTLNSLGSSLTLLRSRVYDELKEQALQYNQLVQSRHMAKE